MKIRPGTTRDHGPGSHLIFLVLAAFALHGHSQENVAAARPAPSSSGADELESQPKTMENWLDALAQAESGNRERLVHRDRDGQLYYGCLQFQAKTFRVYVRRFHLAPESSRSEIMSRIYDCGFQKRLALAMIRSDPSNWKHWRWTVERKIGLPPTDAGAEARDP